MQATAPWIRRSWSTPGLTVRMALNTIRKLNVVMPTY